MVPCLDNHLSTDWFSNGAGSDAASEAWNVLFYSTSDESWGKWQIIMRPHPEASRQTEENREEDVRRESFLSV